MLINSIKGCFYMKKWIALLLSLFSIVALSGCGPAEKSTTSSTTAPTEPVQETVAKPVIYLYPEKEQPVSVHLLYDGELTCTYPEYGTGWNVIAKPDGTLLDANGTSYNYLYWEGLSSNSFDFSEGFCVPGKDTAAFLEDVLQKQGLSRKEANEFIVYWLPLMQENPYNLISFQTEDYTQHAKLEITPQPDTLIRVFMAWKPVQEKVEIPEQTFEAPNRTGFTVVEWGGSKTLS